MNRSLRYLSLLALLGGLSLGPAAHAQVAGPAEAVDAFHFALKSGNKQQALELLTADVLVFEQGRIERSRTEYARKHMQEDISFAGVTQRSVSRRTTKLLGNAAWVMSVNRNRGKVNGRPVDFTTNETVVLNRVNGKWRIVHIHWSFEEKTPANP